MFCVYKLTSPSGKSYIGQTINLKRRLYRYKNLKCSGQPKIFNAILKYGFDNFKIEVLWYSNDNTNIEHILNELERDLIYIHNTIENGYNLREGGKKSKLSPESINKMKLTMSMNPHKHDEQTKLKISAAGTGRKHSSETKIKIKNSKIGYKNPMFGKTSSRNGLIGVKNKRSKCVFQYSMEGFFIKEWESVSVARKTLNIRHIDECCNGNRLSSGGFIWKWKEIIRTNN